MSLIGVTRRIRHKNNDGTIIEAEIGAYARNVSEDKDHRFVTDKEKNGWNDKVSASGGNISDTKATEFETSSASFPIPAAGETVKVILGKIKKHLEDLASWRPTVSLIANIVDNCTSTNTDKPLSAKQGKVLQDQITQVNSDYPGYKELWSGSATAGNIITVSDLMKYETYVIVSSTYPMALHGVRWGTRIMASGIDCNSVNGLRAASVSLRINENGSVTVETSKIVMIRSEAVNSALENFSFTNIYGVT